MTTVHNDHQVPPSEDERPTFDDGHHRSSAPLLVVAVVLAAGVILGSSLAMMIAGRGSGERLGTVETSSPAEALSPSETIDGLAAAWADGNWESARALAAPGVVDTARRAFVEGNEVTPVATTTPTAGQLLVTRPDGGYALVYSYRITETNGVPVVSSLNFEGDAG